MYSNVYIEKRAVERLALSTRVQLTSFSTFPSTMFGSPAGREQNMRVELCCLGIGVRVEARASVFRDSGGFTWTFGIIWCHLVTFIEGKVLKNFRALTSPPMQQQMGRLSHHPTNQLPGRPTMTHYLAWSTASFALLWQVDCIIMPMLGFRMDARKLRNQFPSINRTSDQPVINQ